MKPRAGQRSADSRHCHGTGRGAAEPRGPQGTPRASPLALAAAGAKAREEATKEAAGKAC